MSDAVITMTGNATQLMAEYDKLNAKTAKMESELQRVKKASREAGEAAGKMSAGAKKALDDSTTAAEKYRTTLASLRSALDSGTISEEKYKRARAAAQSTYKEATKDVAALAAAERAETKAKSEAEAIINRNRTAVEQHTEGLKVAKRAFDSGRISADAYRKEVARLNEELKDSEAPSKVAETVKNFVAGVTAVGLLKMGLQAVNAELDLQFEKSKKVAGIQKSYAEKSREMRDNFKEDATIGSIAALDATVAGISERTGIDPEIVVEAMTAGLGQKGARTNQQVAQTVESAIQYSRTDAGKASELTQRALLLSNVSGVSDMKAVMGFMAEASNASAIPSIEKFGATGARAINDVIRRGASPEQAGELFATINKMMGDVEGNRSATATTQLVEQMAQFAPKGSAKDNVGEFGVPKSERDAFAAAKTPMEKLAVLQRSPKLRRAFLAESSFETAAKASIEGILSGSPEAMQVMAEAQGKVPALDASVAGAFDKEIARLDSGKAQQNARIQQAAEAGIKRRSTTDLERGRTGSIDELLFGENGLFNDPTIDLPGLDAVTRGMARKHFQRRTLMGASAEEAGRTAIDELRTGATTADGTVDPKLAAAMVETLKAIERNTAGQNAPQAPQVPLFGNDPALNPQPGGGR